MIEIDLPANKMPLDEMKQKLATVFPKYDIQKAYIYGSYVNGGFDFSSDYDFLIDGKIGDQEPFIGNQNVVRQLKRELSEALDRTIDITEMSIIEQPSHTESSRKFKANVMKDKVLVYEQQ
ncbi:nucleotidyltransferase domain-containing protein [Weissella diestrammenae]|uniref:Nucleotidyltransferase domain-containing protein n=1 Tax=Weissella diestrammenae TaxID=1162633 RepID=A0A7G9T3P9_9LACO|nr:nucleotidyltransferase domain-containing protein [Weissella diestrammenae]MCM0582706.1 nucleotidyltransferase domain-containing protein [Weissella diestrammenae]QNN74724.1 nucleotidyltransferase domain-containing protein [Weissella diestrammenae]